MSAQSAATPPTPAALALLSVASALFPLLETGGLADVVGALPGALAAGRAPLHRRHSGFHLNKSD